MSAGLHMDCCCGDNACSIMGQASRIRIRYEIAPFAVSYRTAPLPPDDWLPFQDYVNRIYSTAPLVVDHEADLQLWYLNTYYGYYTIPRIVRTLRPAIELPGVGHPNMNWGPDWDCVNFFPIDGSLDPYYYGTVHPIQWENLMDPHDNNAFLTTQLSATFRPESCALSVGVHFNNQRLREPNAPYPTRCFPACMYPTFAQGYPVFPQSSLRVSLPVHNEALAGGDGHWWVEQSGLVEHVCQNSAADEFAIYEYARPWIHTREFKERWLYGLTGEHPVYAWECRRFIHENDPVFFEYSLRLDVYGSSGPQVFNSPPRDGRYISKPFIKYFYGWPGHWNQTQFSFGIHNHNQFGQAEPLQWSAEARGNPAWVTLTPQVSGTLAPGESTSITAVINSQDGELIDPMVGFIVDVRDVQNDITVSGAISGENVLPGRLTPTTTQLVSRHPDGELAPESLTYNLVNQGTVNMTWYAAVDTYPNPAWITTQHVGGVLAPGASTQIVLTWLPAVHQLPPGHTFLAYLTLRIYGASLTPFIVQRVIEIDIEE